MEDIHVLVIDDEPALTRSVQSYLEDFDYIVDTANTGEEGIEEFSKNGYDVVITDLMMPGISGNEVLTYVKEHAPDTPTIVASGAGRVSDALTAIRNGAWDYLTKPIEDLDILRITLERVLEKARLKRENVQYQHHLEELVDQKTKKLSQTIAELHKSKENLNSILSGVGDLVIVTDEEGVITKVNPAVLFALGLDLSEVENKSLDSVFAIDADLYEKMRNTVAHEMFIIKETQIVAQHSKREYIVVGTVTGLYDEYDKIKEGMVITLTDITQSKILERQLQHSQKMESIGRLASGISHDFRNVLSGIIGISELVLLKIDDVELKDLIHAMLTAADSSSNLINKLLSFSRQEEVVFNTIDIVSLLRDTDTILRHSLPSSISISIDSINETLFVYGNSAEIQNSLINLAINAKDAMHDHGDLDIKVRVEMVNAMKSRSIRPIIDHGEYVTIAVTDTGTGIDSANLKSIFEPFFTTKEEGKGTGLGLATVYGMVDSHNGGIEVNSISGQGTTFKLYLPRYKKDEGVLSEKDTSLSGKFILIVDDDKTNSLLLKTILENSSATVSIVNTGNEALALFKKQYDKISLVCIKLGLKDINGIVCAGLMREISKSVQVVLSTGTELTTVSLTEKSIKGIVKKPYVKEEIVPLIQSILD